MAVSKATPIDFGGHIQHQASGIEQEKHGHQDGSLMVAEGQAPQNQKDVEGLAKQKEYQTKDFTLRDRQRAAEVKMWQHRQ